MGHKPADDRFAPRWKITDATQVKFKSSHETYTTNRGEGLCWSLFSSYYTYSKSVTYYQVATFAQIILRVTAPKLYPAHTML